VALRDIDRVLYHQVRVMTLLHSLNKKNGRGAFFEDQKRGKIRAISGKSIDHFFFSKIATTLQFLPYHHLVIILLAQATISRPHSITHGCNRPPSLH